MWSKPIYNEPEIPKTPYDNWIKKSAGVYEKLTFYSEPYIKLTTVGYNDYTFSDGYWTYKDDNKNLFKILDKMNDIRMKKDKKFSEEDARKYLFNYKLLSSFAASFTKKDRWKYDGTKNYDWNSERGSYPVSSRFKNFKAQKNLDPSLKTISLIKDENELKKSLRLTDEEQLKYKEYYERIYNENKSPDFDYKKHMPWSDTFNYDLIKQKLDFEKYDYLFLKDFWSFLYINVYFETMHSGVWELDGGIELGDFKIDANEKKIEIGLYIPPKKSNEKPRKIPDRLPSSDIWYEDPRLNSFLVPIEKGKINTFDLNDYNLWIL
ncbi:hypothetical protein CJJ23_04105 [Mycoplasmopsis agassizii]|uniref:Uncharacterized protein n=1 Tax=Mycoplasmopsis agassizii TaxID=33922 RepID=A0A269TI03_9BACT|nr:hypothetical protein [Mycoplasmopsis agassizii]PAK21021.1 hypothetical protein CJJ23_04105 [Mycoplasmopsis agassizii]